MKQIGISIIVLFLMLIVVQSLHAGGTKRLALFGAKSTALNALYYAGVDGITNVYTNPAGLIYNSGKGFEMTGFSRTEEQIFDSNMRGLYRSLYEDDMNFGAGFYWSFAENMSFAISYESTVDYRVTWPYVLLEKVGTSSVTIASDMYNEVFNQIISPTFSYKMGDLSIGLSANIMNVKQRIAFAQSNSKVSQNVGLPAYQFDFSQSGWAWKVNLGLMYQVNDDFRLGFAVMNNSSTTISGKAHTKLYEVTDSAKNVSDVESDYQTPWQFGAGCVYNISHNLFLNLDMRYNLYSGLDEQINLKYSESKWQQNSIRQDSVTGFSPASLIQKFENSFDVGVGLEYAAGSDVHLYFGYRYSSSPNSEETFSLLMPAVNQHSVSAGFSYFDDEMSIDASIVYTRGIEKTISNSPYSVHNGTYSSNGVIPTLTFKWKL
jgi:long-subunit fatty acid transport protein